MICVALQEQNVSRCLRILESLEMAEIRIDMAHLTEDSVREIFTKSKTKLIATCRADGYTDEERKHLLKIAIESGASYVDIEIETDYYYKKEMMQYAWKHSTSVIVSYHNFKETPSIEELNGIVNECFASGANIAKIATMVNVPQDNARLLSLYDSSRMVVALGMGQYGKITRVIAPMLSSPFTFAALDDVSATAPGQIDQHKLRDYQKKLLSL